MLSGELYFILMTYVREVHTRSHAYLICLVVRNTRATLYSSTKKQLTMAGATFFVISLSNQLLYKLIL